MFDEFVQSSRSQSNGAPPVQSAQGFFEQDEGGREPIGNGFPPMTALETGFVSSDAQTQLGDGRGVGTKDAQLPVFQLGRVQYAFSAPLALLCVASNKLTMCLYAYPSPARLAQGAPLPAPPKLVRIDLDDPEKTLEAEVPLPPLSRSRTAPAPDPSLQGPNKMFADPSGQHLILSTRGGDNFYWISGWRKARLLTKLKGLVIESVAWNHLADPSKAMRTPAAAIAASSSRGHRRTGSGTSTPVLVSTKEILLGTQSGDIYEMTLSTTNAQENEEGDFLDRLARRTAGSVGASGNSDVDKYLAHVYRLSERQPITGLISEVFMTGTQSRAVVIATTSTRIYEFVGELGRRRTETEGDASDPLYEKLFSRYRSDAIPNLKSELPGDLPYSELHTWTPKGKRLAKALAWLTGPGVYHGMLSYGDQQVGDSIIDSANLLPYPAVAMEAQNGQEETVAEIPLSIALTDFHFILLYRDRVMAISSLDDQIIFQESLPLQPQERVIATAVDVARKTYWLYTDASIFELVINSEDRHVWRIHLGRGQHDQALQFAKTPAQREMILSSQGDFFFQEGRHIQAAQCYAQTHVRTFEEVTLQFIDRNERDALRYYLVMRLERLRRTDLTQRMMLATWLVEIYLAKINELEDIASAEEASQNVDNYRIELELLKDELKQFLGTYADDLDRRTVFELITRHGRTEFMLSYAAIMGEHSRIVEHWVSEGAWEKAISAVSAQHSLDLYYKFAATLIRHSPAQTVDSWIKQERLSPRRLMPAMVQYRPKEGEVHQVVRYLQHVTRGGATNTLLHNYLLSLLADTDDAALLSQIASNNNNPLTGQPLYDLDYALRVCNERGKIEACVRIYAKKGDFESAVDLAIKAGNVDLACTCADAVQHRNTVQFGLASSGTNPGAADALESRMTLRKKLWLKVARFVVEEKKDMSSAMEFLSRAPDLLSIEDILPFFPDFTVIDSFKDDICQALENYSQRIDNLKTEMDQATQSAESIRMDTQRLANRFVSVEAEDRCSVCQEAVLHRQFYVFACGHAFHADCLITEVTRTLPPRTLRRILVLQERLSKLTGGLVPSLPPSYADAVGEGKRSGAGSERLLQGNFASSAGHGAVNMLGLDKLRELVLPDVIVGAISTSVSMSVAGGRKVLAPLDPFADPSASMRARHGVNLQLDADTQANDGDNTVATSVKLGPGARGGRATEEEEQIGALREELDGLVASACLLCDGSVQAINRPFISEPHDLEDWAL